MSGKDSEKVSNLIFEPFSYSLAEENLSFLVPSRLPNPPTLHKLPADPILVANTLF